MSLKIIFGVLIPLALIVILVGLSASNIGLTVKKEAIDSVNFGTIFTSYDNYNSPTKYVPIKTITIENNFFMPRVQELDNVVVCAVSDQNSIARLNFQVRYSETKYQEGINDIGLLEPASMGRSYYGSSSGKATVTLPARSAKTVTLFIEPNRVYQNNNGAADLTQYKGYTKLLVIENPKSNDYYYGCDNLPADQLAKAEVIPITGQGSAPIVFQIGNT